MAKGFNLILGTTDSENVLTTETVQVRAGSPHFDPPQVGFTFPPQIAPKIGEVTGPQWPVGEYWAFAFCRVVPTPSDDGTGRFFVQYYYNSGNWPNDPSRLFEQTFDGTATTLDGNLYSYTLDSIAINAGGGDATYGFANQNDVSGLRHGLVITNADLSYVYEGRTGDRAFRTGGDRAGFRNPGTDELIAAYKYSSGQQKLFTLERLERASGLPTWGSGSQIIAHPYHYVPLYQNDGAVNYAVLPRVLVIEEGAQFPLTGLFHVSGTTVTGQYTRFLQEVASGSQMAVRFVGDETWFLVSGVLSSSGLVLFDYGLNPQVVSGSAEAAPYALGSGVVTVLPGLVGCANWDIAFTPDVRDGDGFPNLSGVVFTAAPIEIVAGGAPSGALSYVWQVQPLGGAITTISNSGNQISVNFSNSATVPIDVRVFVSGAGQPTCVHSDSTGYITLKKSVTAGTFYCDSRVSLLNLTTKEAETVDYWKRYGNNTDTIAYFHHQIYAFEPYQAFLNETWTTTNTYISIKKGQIDSWPSNGTFCIAYQQSSTAVRHIYGIFSGKQTNTTDDRLTGVTIVGSFLLDRNYAVSSVSTGAGIASVPATTTTTFIFMPVPGTWPFTFVKSRLSNTALLLENLTAFSQRNLGINGTTNSKTDVWFFKSGNPIHVNTMTAGAGPSQQMSFLNPLPSWVDAGAVIALAPWDSQRTGNQETIIPTTYWNRGNMGLMYVSLPAAYGLQYVDTLNTHRIYVSDATKRASTGTMGSMPRYTWIPPQGRLVVPNYDRTKTLVFTYQNFVEFANGLGDETQGVYFDNCRLVQVNGSATSGYLQANQIIVPYKEVKMDPVPFVSTKTGVTPEYSVASPGLGIWTIGYNTTLVDVIKANTSPTNPALPGSEATPISQPNWEKFITNFPTNGIVATDPLYRKVVPGGSGGSTGDGGGGCLVGWTIVTIKHQDGFAKEVPISEVVVGDLICSMDRTTYAMKWCKVTNVVKLERNEAFELITIRGKSILVTGTHPIATCNEKQWTPVEELEIGTWIETEDGPDLLAEKKPVQDNLRVYDLTVDVLHTFIAGGILVHNKYKQNV